MTFLDAIVSLDCGYERDSVILNKPNYRYMVRLIGQSVIETVRKVLNKNY